MSCALGGWEGTFAFSTLSTLLTMLRTHGVQSPQHPQQQPQRVAGRMAEDKHWTRHVTPHRSHPGFKSDSSPSGRTPATHGPYRPQHPPQKQQQGTQHTASTLNRAQAFTVKAHVISSSLSFAARRLRLFAIVYSSVAAGYMSSIKFFH